MSNLIGRHIGNYEILALLGEGGMATVYRARQTSMKRDVAIKVIESKLARNEDFLRRFEREAQTVAALSHPHILKVFEYGKHEDTVYLVMELLRGGSLAQLIRQGALSPERAGHVLEQIASALDYAHRQGIIHRDLKPQNVLLDGEGNAHLTDFGIAKLLSETSALTQSGVAMGTPAYMSPEQWQGQSLDNRADIYALGIMLFEMLTGRLPYLADTPFSMMHMHVNVPPPGARELRADLPPGVDGVIQKALSKTREGRFNTAGELATAFKAALGGGTPVVVTNAAPLLSNEDTLAQVRSTPPIPPVAPPPPTGSGRSGRFLYLGIGAIILLVLIIGAAAIIGGGQGTPTASSQTQIIGLPTFTPILVAVRTTAPAASPTVTAASPLFRPTEGPTLDIVYVAQTADARDTAAAHLTAMAATQTQVVEQTLTATLWTATPTVTRTPTPNITASLDAFRTNRAATATGQYHANQTATATLWTPTPTPTPTFTPTGTLLPAVTSNQQWKPIVQEFYGVEMVHVPPGCYLMGSADGNDDEKPVNKQCFDQPFWIDKTEVTQEQFQRFGGVAANASNFQGANRPEEQITWFEARNFCARRGARLPTEREWEYAARGPDNLVYPWGNTFEAHNTVFDLTLNDGTAEVGSIPAGASWVGALDLSGNVWEWTSSIYLSYPYHNEYHWENNDDAISRRVLRGGAWDTSDPFSIRATSRGGNSPSFSYASIGFRCAHSFGTTGTDTTIATSAVNAPAGQPTPFPTVTSNQQWKPIVQEFYGVEMVHVPPGCYLMGSADGNDDEKPVNKQCFDQPFWIDKTEVTQEQFQRFGGVAANASNFQGANRPEEQITWFEARNFCARRGARLPTEREWEYAARGPDNLVYPWGNTFEAHNTVFDLTLNDGTAEVGSIPAGASWVGALDLSGNVWEWTSSIYLSYPYHNEYHWENNDDAISRRVLRGGAWDTSDPFSIRATSRGGNSPSFSYASIGFRCAHSFGTTGTDTTIATSAVNAPAGQPTPFPTVTSNQQWKPIVQEFYGVEMMLVPPGCYLMGSADGNDDEKPVNKQCFDQPFWIDKTEVTQEQFQRFGGVAANASNFQGANRPEEQITWFEARNFCARRGARLPTEREWEYAARGPDNLVYPWGNTFEAHNTVFDLTLNDGTAEVGSIPAGASWVGALDLSGNVWEWTSSIYLSYPYHNEYHWENNDDATSRRVLRGGAWDTSNPFSIRATSRGGNSPSFSYASIGFRCARSA